MDGVVRRHRGGLAALGGEPPDHEGFDGEGGRRAMKVEGSGIIVAGGGSGLGLAAATALRDAGARVGVIDMQQGAWDGPFADADVSDDAAVERAFDAPAPVIDTMRAKIGRAHV